MEGGPIQNHAKFEIEGLFWIGAFNIQGIELIVEIILNLKFKVVFSLEHSIDKKSRRLVRSCLIFVLHTKRTKTIHKSSQFVRLGSISIKWIELKRVL